MPVSRNFQKKMDLQLLHSQGYPKEPINIFTPDEEQLQRIINAVEHNMMNRVRPQTAFVLGVLVSSALSLFILLFI